ncbi:extracellular solute-binding protein [Paenibacillus hodogayensis]|uniref:Extracellular solute-binding protein n=1 Tax=Paenibacillus hodogayensis TaxID=279208 RepID=A0ABV5W665_9BACL
MTTRPTGKPYRLDDLIALLREDIVVHGKYAPGDYLPSELALVKQFGLSNKTVRKGLEQLMNAGLIEKIPRVGSIVTHAAKRPVSTLVLGSMHSLDRDMRLPGLIEQFEKLHPDIRVEVVNLAHGEHGGTMESHLNAGLVDAAMINDEIFWGMTESGRELPFEPLSPPDGTYPFLNDMFACSGTQLALPVIFSPVVLAYNKDHFREAGVQEPDGSWTWADAIECASRLAVPGQRYGLCFYPLSNNRWPVFPLQSGSGFQRDGEGKIRLQGTKLLENIRLYKSIVRDRDMFPDYMAESSRDFVHLFGRGQASMIISTYMLLNEFAKEGPSYDISPVPFNGEPRTLLTSIGIAVNRLSRNKPAARTLAEFLVSESAQRFIRERSLSIPAMKRVADGPAEDEAGLNRPARFHLYRNIVPGYRRHRDLGLAPKSFYALRELLKQYVADLIDEHALCAQLDQGVDGNARKEGAP